VLRVFTDGASRGNPGPSGLGVVIEDEHGVRLRAFHRWLDRMTNNEAEYHALVDGLKAVQDWKADSVEFNLDSKLVVEQMNGVWKIKKPELHRLYEQAKALANSLDDVVFQHVERERNKGADALANMAIDEHLKKPARGSVSG
jgi:ribonuclease HI